MVEYKCKKCDYITARKSNYERHCSSKSHKVDIEKSMSTNSANMSTNTVDIEDKRIHKKVSCEYCEKLFFNSCSLKRHKETCNSRMKKLIEENEKLLQKTENLKKERDKVIKENAKIGYELACSEKTNVIMNANYILNVFTNAHNIEDCLNKELTDEEKHNFLSMGALRGSNKFISDRCIENISVEQRPFHCVDYSRDKFMTRSNNKWEVDMNADIILEKVTDVVTPLYPTNIDDLNQRTKNLKSITDLKSSDVNKALIKNIKGKTLLKNDVDKHLITE